MSIIKETLNKLQKFEDYDQMPYRVVCKDTNDVVIDIQGHSNEKEALADFEAVIAENINDKVAVITLDKLINGEYEQVKRYNVYSDELMENINETSEDYNEEIAKQLFKKVNANAPIEEYILHTSNDFYSLYMSGDYIVMPGDVMEDIMYEIITSLQNTLPAELQMCFDHTRAVGECLRNDLTLMSVYEQVQALDKRFDTFFGSVKADYLNGKKYYVINITE